MDWPQRHARAVLFGAADAGIINRAGDQIGRSEGRACCHLALLFHRLQRSCEGTDEFAG